MRLTGATVASIRRRQARARRMRKLALAIVEANRRVGKELLYAAFAEGARFTGENEKTLRERFADFIDGVDRA